MTDIGQCSIWPGGRSGDYGWTPDQQYAHRVAWEEAYGPIPDGMSVLHRCDVGLCICPTHLFLGTQLDNVRDMISKGRGGNLTPEAIACRGIAQRGQPKSETARLRMSEAHKGVPLSPEHRAKVTAVHRGPKGHYIK